ncbi:MAG: hypothetical protein KatS3mg023_1146 [Armatimonadota bacterium]|nr:MAG: hypothetical protein KatS3mg023_1146 [Armatimonadota bacterium]
MVLKRFLFALLWGVYFVSSLCTLSSAQSLIWLGTLGGSESIATGVSADGRSVVGWAKLVSGKQHAFLWTPTAGMQDLGVLPSYSNESKALAISADGKVVVGESVSPSGTSYAFRWTLAEGMRAIGTLGGSWSRAWGVSADGGVIVGESATAAGVGHAFRWSQQGGMRDMGTLGGSWSGARDVSADGVMVTGWAYTPDGEYHACRWDGSGLATDLDTLGGSHSMATGISSDGTVVVGWSYNDAALFRAFRWVETDEIRELGMLPNSYYVWAYDVSGDGQTAVGETSLLSAGGRALRWRTGGGTEDLNVTYSNLLTDGSILEGARAISPDGRFIVGYGIHATARRTEAFLLDTQAGVFQVRGNLQLRDYDGDSTQVPITVEWRQNGSAVRMEDIFVDARGNYTLQNVSSGSYDVGFKASHWLRVVIRGVTVADRDVNGVHAALTNGDVDGDNEVTLFDFGQLVAAFGSLPGDGNWNAGADLDGDAEVTLFDFGILLRNFGAIGDEP